MVFVDSLDSGLVEGLEFRKETVLNVVFGVKLETELGVVLETEVEIKLEAELETEAEVEAELDLNFGFELDLKLDLVFSATFEAGFLIGDNSNTESSITASTSRKRFLSVCIC